MTRHNDQEITTLARKQLWIRLNDERGEKIKQSLEAFRRATPAGEKIPSEAEAARQLIEKGHADWKAEKRAR